MKKNTGGKILIRNDQVRMFSLQKKPVRVGHIIKSEEEMIGRIFNDESGKIHTKFYTSGNEEAHRNALVDILDLLIGDDCDVMNNILGTFVEKFSVEDDSHHILDGKWNEGAHNPSKDPKKVYGFYIFKKGGAGMKVDEKFYTCNPNDGEYACMIIRGDLEFEHLLEKGKKKEFIHLVTYTE